MRCFSEMKGKTMNDNRKYSIRLANGNERNFDSAAEMAKWIAEQRENDRPILKKSARPRRRSASRAVRCYSGESPLARYAKRNSDET